jgi:hypothetical protein
MAQGKIKLECEEHKFKAKNPYQMVKHRRDHHGKGGPRAVLVAAVRKVPAHLEGTPKGDAIELLLEQRQTNADEVKRVDRAIAGIITG